LHARGVHGDVAKGVEAKFDVVRHVSIGEKCT